MRQKQKTGLFKQIYTLILLSIVIMGTITAVNQYLISSERIRTQTNISAEAASGEIISSIKEYSAYQWLLTYWADHADEMEVEYDSDFAKGSAAEEKMRLFEKSHPDFDLRYCTDEEAEALPPEDQKVYAEIIYSWLIPRINGIKQNFNCDYLFCAMTDTDTGENPYGYLLFLISGADQGAVRGTDYGQVYTLGVTVSTQEQKTMRQVVANYGANKRASRINDESGKYIDHYNCLCILGDRAILTGVSFSIEAMNRKVLSSALMYTLNSIILELLLLNLVMALISGYILYPLRNILNIIRAYADSKDSSKTEADLNELLSKKRAIAVRQNEIGQLAENFIDLTHEIDDYADEIRAAVAARKRAEVELETAAAIQQHMLPSGIPVFPDYPELKLCGDMKPAKEVGGDFYDYFLVDDTHLALVIADVSDKGVPAALFMAEARTLIRSRAQTGGEPEQILYYVNNQLSEGNERGFFVTVWLALLDMETGEGVAVNAGHEHPVICREGGDFELVKYKHSLAAGLMEGVKFPQHKFRLDPGDKLFVYTDGVPEAQNTSSEQFGTDRMLKALNANREETPAGLLAAVTEEIDLFTGEAGRFDDTTMLCLFRDKTEE